MKVNEIFYSLQGEGFHTGTPAVFVRFSGCNLRCPFCDTDHQKGHEMTEMEIVEQVAQYPARHVVITGGEPGLSLTTALVEGLHSIGRRVAIETNGTTPLPVEVDWITISPKSPYLSTPAAQVRLTRADEVKIVLLEGHEPDAFAEFPADHYFVQPCDTGNEQRNREILKATINYCLAHPQWCLSLQTHKLIGVQ